MSAARDALSDEAAAAKRRVDELEAKAPAAFLSRGSPAQSMLRPLVVSSNPFGLLLGSRVRYS